MFCTLPLMLAMSTMLPGVLNRRIWRPAAWAVYNTPLQFTAMTYNRYADQ